MSLTTQKELTAAQQKNHAKLGEVRHPENRIAKIMEIIGVQADVTRIDEGYLVAQRTSREDTPKADHEILAALSGSFGATTGQMGHRIAQEASAIVAGLAFPQNSGYSRVYIA